MNRNSRPTRGVTRIWSERDLITRLTSSMNQHGMGYRVSQKVTFAVVVLFPDYTCDSQWEVSGEHLEHRVVDAPNTANAISPTVSCNVCEPVCAAPPQVRINRETCCPIPYTSLQYYNLLVTDHRNLTPSPSSPSPLNTCALPRLTSVSSAFRSIETCSCRNSDVQL
jgi:hypothetical protein